MYFTVNFAKTWLYIWVYLLACCTLGPNIICYFTKIYQGLQQTSNMEHIFKVLRYRCFKCPGCATVSIEVFALCGKCPNTEFFLVCFSCIRNLHIQCEYMELRTRKNSVCRKFSRSVGLRLYNNWRCSADKLFLKISQNSQ